MLNIFYTSWMYKKKNVFFARSSEIRIIVLECSADSRELSTKTTSEKFFYYKYRKKWREGKKIESILKEM